MTGTETGTWIKYPKPNSQARLRLFCFPFAGGGAVTFHAWHKALPAEVEVCSIQLPGRESRLREPPLTRLSEMISLLEQAIRPALDKPFAFFGHSLGALICFELARRLRPCFHPFHLFVSGHRAPQLPYLHPPLHRLPDDSLVEELQRRYDGIPQVVLADAELLKLFLPVLRADLTIAETYTYTAGEPLDCPITAFGGLADINVSRSQLAAWSEQTRRSFSLEMFPGDHFFLSNTPDHLLGVIAKNLGDRIIEKRTA